MIARMLAVVVVVSASVAHAQAARPNPGPGLSAGGGTVNGDLTVTGNISAGNLLSSAAVCQITGGTDCTMTGVINMPNATAGAPALAWSTTGLYRPAASQIGFSIAGVVGAIFAANTYSFYDSAGQDDLDIIPSTSITNGGIIRSGNGSGSAIKLTSNAAMLGASTDVGSTTTAACLGESIGTGSGSCLLTVYGGGLEQLTAQTATCSGGVVTVDPTAPVVNLNANSAACVVTIGKANGRFETDVLFVVDHVSGAVTFPNVAGTHAGPTAATTTGLSTNGSTYRIHYSSANTEYVGVSVSNN